MHRINLKKSSQIEFFVLAAVNKWFSIVCILLQNYLRYAGAMMAFNVHFIVRMRSKCRMGNGIRGIRLVSVWPVEGTLDRK